MMIDSDKIRKVYQNAMTIAMALMGGCVMLGGIVYVLITQPLTEPTHTVNAGFLQQMAFLLSVTVLIGSFLVKKKILKKQTGSMVSVDKSIEISLAPLLTATIVTFALCEGAVLLGIVVSFLTREPNDLLLPLMTGIVGFTAHFPRYEQWERWIRES